MEKWIKKIMQFGGLFLFMSCNQPVDVVTIDLSREEAEIPPSLYGIFFEEITHSGDGGLYAEMIRNRGFELLSVQRSHFASYFAAGSIFFFLII